MADTYGRGPNGEMLYDPSSYDSYGVYMGNRAPLVGQSNVGTPGFNAWTSNASFEDWLPQYAKTQLARGRGSLGPEVTAAQGTPEYRDQVAKQQEAAQWIIDRGGTVGDMGIRPAKGAGLNLWNKYSGYKGGTYGDQFMSQARQMYARRAEMAARAGTGGQGAGNTAAAGGFGTQGSTGGAGSFTPGTGGVAPSTTAQMNAPARPMGAPQPMPGASTSFSPAAPGATPQDSYMQTPRGSRRGLRGLIGG